MVEKRIKYQVLFLFSLALFFLFGFIAFSTNSRSVLADPYDTHKIKICHWDEGHGGRWQKKEVDKDSTDAGGHDSHDKDIIPPYHYDFYKGQQHFVGDYPGKNWDSFHQSIWNNDCEVMSASPSPQPSLSPSPTPSSPSPSPSASPSQEPSPTPTPSPTPSFTPEESPTFTPTPSLIPSPSPEESELPAPSSSSEVTDLCTNIEGIQTSVPDGLHLNATGHECVAYELGGPGGVGGVPSGGQVLGMSTMGKGQVLGAQTLAHTGKSQDIILPFGFVGGVVLSILGFKKTLEKKNKEIL